MIPPYWQTIWFRVMAFILAAGLMWGGYTLRVRNIQKQKTELQRIVDERTEELRKERHALEEMYGELERRVTARTEELSAANRRLLAEINERKKTEEERVKLEEQLFQAQKMESIGRLAGGIAHDFNNILTSIMGYAELLRMQFNNPKTSEGQAAEIIIQGTERAANLTKQLLGFARHGKYKIVPLNINDHLVNMIRVSEKMFEKNISVTFDLDKQVRNVEADANQLDQVFTNLLINAKDAMPTGGKLTVKSENVYLGEEFKEQFTEFFPGNYVKISISDTGIGIPKENIQNIYEPFYTTKGEGKGTGLGLAMVYGIVKNHHGQILCDSIPGQGTTFTLYFPASDKEIDTETPEKTLISGSAKILVVDDEREILMMAREQLEYLGYSVVTAKDGVEAIEKYSRLHQEIDLVLLDMIMPNMSGKETSEKLLEINPEVKILLVSGFSQDDRVAEILEEGVMGFIQKPFRLHEISHKISEALVRWK